MSTNTPNDESELNSVQDPLDSTLMPEESPGKPKTGVRRVNNMPLILGGVAGMFFIGIIGMVAANRNAAQNAQSDPQSQEAPAPKSAGMSSQKLAEEAAGDPRAGLAEPATASASEPDVLVAHGDLDQPPKPAGGAASSAAPGAGLTPPGAGMGTPPRTSLGGPADDPNVAQERERIRQAKAQLLDEAVKSKTSVQIAAARGTGSTPGGPISRDDALNRIAGLRQQAEAAQSQDPTAAYRQRLEQIRAAGLVPGGGSGIPSGQLVKTAAPASGQGAYSEFDGQADRWTAEAKVEAPKTPYVLRTGFVIPATLISGINSDLPGQISAQVSQDVYDTATGAHRLIPQGSRLIGSYGSNVAFGQARVLVAWQRIVFPDGKALDIGSMPGTDSAGYAGFNDQVNNHLLRLYANAFLMSGVTAGVALSQPSTTNANGRPTASSAMSEALGQQLGQVTAQLIAKNMSIAPTLEIRPGYRFNVTVVKDLVFTKPYRQFDY